MIDNKIAKNNPQQQQLLKTGIFKSGKYTSELTQIEFMEAATYNPDDYELLNSLSQIFIEYQKNIVNFKPLIGKIQGLL